MKIYQIKTRPAKGIFYNPTLCEVSLVGDFSISIFIFFKIMQSARFSNLKLFKE